ncbi:WD domain, G-beta repeat protein [Dictyocaulus viviparus]|uniref:WD domain, G-beta repeat protein n=1 Tax=Dictyocaulus viviparus TaxID=29172 RepID=A0A0D8XI28_DICVI|nr:WD domain, G-beta repeat protein [Dictyocaulus viviparus]
MGPRHILVGGGGGESKTGVSNLMQTYLLTFEKKAVLKCSTPMQAKLVGTIDTDVYATMNMDVVCYSNPEKGRYLIAAGHGQYCDVYETTGYSVGKDDSDKDALVYNIRNVGRLTTSEKVESFQKCVRFDHSTAGKRVVTGGEDGRVRVSLLFKNPETVHQPILDIEAHKSDVFDIDISLDGRVIVSVGHDGVAKMWDMNLGTLIQEVPFPTECKSGYKVRSIRCTPLGSGSNLVFVAGYNPVSLSAKHVSYLSLWAYSRERQSLRIVVLRSTGQADNTHGIFVTAVEFLDRTAPDVLSLVPQPTSGNPRQIPGPGSCARASIISLSADQTIQVHNLLFDTSSTSLFLIKLFFISTVVYYVIWYISFF